MAVIAAAAAIPALGVTAVNLGVVGAAVVAGGIYAVAGYVDQRYVMPALFGKGRSNAQADSLLDVTVGSNAPGAPRIYAMGRMVRVPTHVLWQSEKLRESTTSHSKAGTSISQRQVYLDAAIALNDRVTKRLNQLIGNGQLLLLTTRNLVSIMSPSMTAVEAGGIITLSMATLDDPDFTNKFKVGDHAQVEGFVSSSGGNLNVGQYEVVAVEPHRAFVTSRMALLPATNQSGLSGTIATSGSPASPGKVSRVDDKLIDGAAMIDSISGVGSGVFMNLTFARNPAVVFRVGDVVGIDGFIDLSAIVTPGLSWVVDKIASSGSTYYIVLVSNNGFGGTPPAGPYPLAASLSQSNQARIYFWSNPVASANLFPPTFVPLDHFYAGTEDQLPDSIVEAGLGVGNTSPYRGVSYQVLDDFLVTNFGDSLPFNLEAVIEVDSGLTWPGALRIVCERAGLAPQFVDTADVTNTPFEGYYMRGPVAGVTNLMPLLLVGAISTQERDGRLCFFDADRADVIQLRNGLRFSDLGARSNSEKSSAGDDEKLKFSQIDPDDLPTFVGARYQDTDNGLAEGYQSHGLRHPNGDETQNVQEFNFRSLAMSGKQAKGVCATLLRKAWINSQVCELSLPPSYAFILEGDFVPVTDDNGNEFNMRVRTRERGTNLLIKLTCIRDDTELQVHGSPTQLAQPPAAVTLMSPPALKVDVFDVAPLLDSFADAPGLIVAANARGDRWSGATIYASIDGEITWRQLGTSQYEAAIGNLVTDLPAGSTAETYGSSSITYDNTHTFDVAFDAPAYLLSMLTTVSSAVVEGGANWLAIVDDDGTTEIVGVKTVTALGGGVYRFANLLRGLRGTWNAAASLRSAGARVVVLTTSGVGPDVWNSLVKIPATVLSADVSIRVVPPGRDIASVESMTITPTWRNCSPLDPRVLTKSIGSAPYDAVFATERWTRQVMPLGSLPPYPLDDIPEAFLYTIWDPTGATIVRTKLRTAEGTGSPTLLSTSVTYTAAEQTADGYTPGASATFYVAVQQVGQYGKSRLIKRHI